MSDNKDVQDGRDRSKISLQDDYELSYLASKFQLSTDELRAAVERHGPSREAVEAALKKG